MKTKAKKKPTRPRPSTESELACYALGRGVATEDLRDVLRRAWSAAHAATRCNGFASMCPGCQRRLRDVAGELETLLKANH